MLQKLGFLPGFNKQVTSTGAEGQWTGGNNVRFRYGSPEKVGGRGEKNQEEQISLKELNDLLHQQEQGETINKERLYELQLYERLRQDEELTEAQVRDLLFYKKRRQLVKRYEKE